LTPSEIIFYLLAAMALGSAILAVTSTRIFRAAIFLLFALMGVAGLYLWMSFEFVFAVQIIVYVGGIVVLIIFSIFLTQQGGTHLPPVLRGRGLFAGLASLAGFLSVWQLVSRYDFPGAPGKAPGMTAIGTGLLSTDDTGMALPFEVVSILLLAAMVGCIVIAFKYKPHTR